MVLLTAHCDTNNHCQKYLEHQAICVLFLYCQILFPDAPISAPPSIQNNFYNIEKYHKNHRKGVLPNPLRRFVVNQHCSKGEGEWLNFPLKTDVSVPRLLAGHCSLIITDGFQLQVSLYPEQRPLPFPCS